MVLPTPDRGWHSSCVLKTVAEGTTKPEPLEGMAMRTDWLHTLDDTGRTPLIRASVCGRSEVTTLMLMQEIEDDPKRFQQLPTLHRAACWGFDDVVVELIEDGADVGETDTQGETALHKAARLGNHAVAAILLENGAEVNAKDCLGMTALHWAALTGCKEMVEILLAHFADVESRDYFSGGLSPIGIAKLLGYTEIAQMMQNRFSFF